MSLISKLGSLLGVEAEQKKSDSDLAFKVTITMDESPYRAHTLERTSPLRVAVQSPAQEVFQQEFTIVDIETTGLSPDRDTIIEIAALTMAPGFHVISEYSTLVKTDTWIPHNIVEMTGITQAALDAQGIDLAQAMNEFIRHAESRPLFAHNAAFDLGFLRRAAEVHGLKLDNPTYDTLPLAKAAWPGLPAYKLGYLAERLGLPQQPTHRALADVRTTLELIRAAYETLGGSGNWKPKYPASATPHSHSLARPGNENGALYGESITFTGELSMPREAAAELAAKAGCKVSPGVTKKTTLLVVGVQDMTTLAGHQKSSKQRKAEELIAAGQPIRILTEDDFLRLITND